MRLAGVSWIRVPTWDRLDGHPNRWLAVPEPLPRARLVARSQLSHDVWHDLAFVEPDEVGLVGKELALPGGPAGSAFLDRDAPGSIHVLTRAASRQLLVVSESYHRGWRAMVDGEAVPVLRVYADFIGCVVPAGERRVEFEFDPPSLRTGALVSVAGAAAALLLTLAALLHARVAEARPGDS